MTTTIQELRTAGPAMPSLDRYCSITAILRGLEARPKAHYYRNSVEGDTWADTIPLGQPSRFAEADPDEFTTATDFGPSLKSATLEKLGYALHNQRSTGVASAIDKPRSFSQETQATSAPWVAEVMAKMKELVRLPANWDSYGAKPIKPDCLQYAVREVLQACMHGATPAPSVVPTNTGGVMLEWHRGNIDLEVRVENPGEATIYYADADAHEEKEFVLDLSVDRLANLLWKLTQRG